MSIALLNPTPTKEQLKYQQDELIALITFGMNTFTGREWGDGKEDPSLFDPSNLDTDQWIETLYKAGFKKAIITAKHHDGFCLWPSKYTEHSVKNSPWKYGQGDVVKEVYNSCKKYGLKFGIYLSLWDQNSPLYGTGENYNEYYMNQLKELMLNYGPVSEIWMDGAKGTNTEQYYDFDNYFKVIKDINPECIIFSPVGPDARWIGNENGYSGNPCYSTIDISAMKDGENPTYLNHGDKHGNNWVVGEADVSLRPGWFYHESEDNEVKSIEKLKDIYFNSIGSNAVLLLGVSPNKAGKLHENDVNIILEFGNYIESTFSDNLVKEATIIATNDSISDAYNTIDKNYGTYWQPHETSVSSYIELKFNEEKEFNIIEIQECIPLGQNVDEFKIYAYTNDEWFQLYSGLTIGYKHLAKFPTTKTSRIKISFLNYDNAPAINHVGVYKEA